jgi:hypothetical protein
MKESNARIESTMLGYEGHGILTFFLNLDYGDGGKQAVGGYALDRYEKRSNLRMPTTWAGALIAAVLELLGQEEWEDLPGTYIRVRYEHDKVHAIGNLLEDKWLDFDKFFKGQED